MCSLVKLIVCTALLVSNTAADHNDEDNEDGSSEGDEG